MDFVRERSTTKRENAIVSILLVSIGVMRCELHAYLPARERCLQKCAAHKGSLIEKSPNRRRLINDRDINPRRILLCYCRRHFARLDFYFGGFQRSAKPDAFRILAIRTSHLISRPLATRNDKRFDQTFGKHSSGPSGLSRSLNRNSSVASTNNRRSEIG